MTKILPFLTILLIASSVLSLSADASQVAGPSFQGIGIDPGPPSQSIGTWVNGISGDGRVVLGSLDEGTSNGEMAKWTEAGGLELVPGLYPGAPGNPSFAPAPFTGAHDASYDGSVIVGGRRIHQRLWTEETQTIDTSLDGTYLPLGSGGINAVSDDGRTLAGWRDPGTRTAPWYYSPDFGYVQLRLPGAQRVTWGDVEDLSADGEFAVGWISASNFEDADRIPPEFRGTKAFRWQMSTNSLVAIPGIERGVAYAVSNDGRTVVGGSSSVSSPEPGVSIVTNEAFVWNESTGFTITLGDIGTVGRFDSAALAVSANGAVVVGRSSAGAFIWDAENGMRLVADVLAGALGLDLEGWTLTDAAAISADGRVIAGNGFNPDGVREGWVAVIPEPSTVLLVGVGLGVLGVGRRSNPGAVV